MQYHLSYTYPIIDLTILVSDFSAQNYGYNICYDGHSHSRSHAPVIKRKLQYAGKGYSMKTSLHQNLRSYPPFLQVGATLLQCYCYFYKPHLLVYIIGQCCALYNISVCVLVNMQHATSQHAVYQL